MWQDTGAVFRLHLGEDLQFESVGGVGSGQLGGRWNLWGAERCVVAFRLILLKHAATENIRRAVWSPACLA